MFHLITLDEIKDWLAITESGQDSILTTFRDLTSQLIETYIDKKVVTRQFTEFYSGDGKADLLLKHYPVYIKLDSSDDPSNLTIYDDTERDWGSDDLLADSDVWIDPDIGRLKLYNDESGFAIWTANIKVVYWAGYSRFNLVDEVNNYIDVNEGGGEVSVEITPPYGLQTNFPGFSAEDLASAIATALNANGSLSNTYACTYSHLTNKFTISISGGTATMLCSSGSSSSKSIWDLIGFSTSGDKSASASHSSDNTVTGVPSDLVSAAMMITDRFYENSRQGSSRLDIISKNLAQGGTITYAKGFIPETAQAILDSYSRVL